MAEREPGQTAHDAYYAVMGGGWPWEQRGTLSRAAWAAVEAAIRKDERERCLENFRTLLVREALATPALDDRVCAAIRQEPKP